jgi:hypothetical protein
MTYVLIRAGLVVHCVSVNDLQSLAECYPDCLILKRVGGEDIGWTYDGTSFTAPA